MANKTRNVKLKPHRVIGAAAVILLVTFGADSVRRNLSNDEHHNLVIDGDFIPNIEAPSIPEPSSHESENEEKSAVTLANENC
jgi:hypothetical protein